MNRRLILVAIIVTAFLCSTLGQLWLRRTPAVQTGRDANEPGPYARIVSLAPSITEVLFKLELDERIVGVTRYCKHPAAALEKPQVGSYLSPNYEAIVALRPDLVLTLPEHAAEEEALTALGIHWDRLDHRSVAGIVASIRQVGQLTDENERAQVFAQDLERRIARVQQLTLGHRRPRVLIS
ncbi:MAG: helical backbone metal receptor, partial [Gemmatimonadetes bacterium]|nr:helical backbone metal receptor [Gemmatimonadota bacterium]